MSDPVDRFREILAAAVVSGIAHLKALDGGLPVDPLGWGWQKRNGTLLARGDHIGWVENDDLFLIPDAAYRVAEKFARDQGGTIGMAKNRLIKNMAEQGLIRSKGKTHNTVRKTVETKVRRVLHVSVSFIDGCGK